MKVHHVTTPWKWLLPCADALGRGSMTGYRTVLAMLALLCTLLVDAQTANPPETQARAQQTSLPADTTATRRTGFILKTNLLYDAVIIPNIGVEISLGRRWTAAADWFYTWFSSDNRHRYWQGYGGYLTLRKYFGTAAQGAPFTGHHVGAYGLGLTYDVEWGGRGYQADHFGFGGGLEYGYSTVIGRRLCLDFSLGLGFQDGEYKKYDPVDTHYVWHSTNKRHWWGPTKAEITLKWLIGGKVVKVVGNASKRCVAQPVVGNASERCIQKGGDQ